MFFRAFSGVGEGAPPPPGIGSVRDPHTDPFGFQPRAHGDASPLGSSWQNEIEKTYLRGDYPVLNVILYMIALISGILAFSGIAGGAVAAMMTLFQVSLVLLVLSLLTRGFSRRVAWY